MQNENNTRKERIDRVFIRCDQTVGTAMIQLFHLDTIPGLVTIEAGNMV